MKKKNIRMKALVTSCAMLLSICPISVVNVEGKAEIFSENDVDEKVSLVNKNNCDKRDCFCDRNDAQSDCNRIDAQSDCNRIDAQCDCMVDNRVSRVSKNCFMKKVANDDDLFSKDVTLVDDIYIDGDCEFKNKIDLNGHVLMVNGCVKAYDDICVNKGTFDVGKDFTMVSGGLSIGKGECFFGGDFSLVDSGHIIMNDFGDIIVVYGNCFIRTNAGSISSCRNVLDNGLMSLYGDFSQVNYQSGLGDNFCPGVNHEVNMIGAGEQRVSFDSKSSYFQGFISKNSKTKFVKNVTVKNWLGSSCINMDGKEIDLDGYDKHVLDIYGNVYLKKDINLDGKILRIHGNLVHSDGCVMFNGGTLIVDGTYSLTQNASMNMSDVADKLSVGYNLNFANMKESVLDNGTIFLRGSLIQSGEYINNFCPVKGHTVVFDGTSRQDVVFDNTCCSINNMISDNPNLIFGKFAFFKRLIRNSAIKSFTSYSKNEWIRKLNGYKLCINGEVVDYDSYKLENNIVEENEIDTKNRECDHDYGLEIVKNESMCSSDGAVYGICNKCLENGEIEYSQKLLKTIPHVQEPYPILIIKKPTLSNDEYHRYVCSECNYDILENRVMVKYSFDENIDDNEVGIEKDYDINKDYTKHLQTITTDYNNKDWTLVRTIKPTLATRGYSIYKNIYSGYEIKYNVKNPLKDIAKMDISLISKNLKFTGKVLNIQFRILDKTTKLVVNKDYKVENMENASLAGTNYVTIVGIGNYAGKSKQKVVVAKRNINECTCNKLKVYTCTNKAIKPYIELRNNGNLVASGYYKKTYKSNKNPGKGSIIIYGCGKNYTGKKVIYFYIKPKKEKLHSLKSKKGNLTIKWYRDNKITGMNIQISRKASFKSGVRNITIKSKKINTKTIAKLAKNKRYYVRIRGYKMVGKTKLLGAWSPKKSIVIKK